MTKIKKDKVTLRFYICKDIYDELAKVRIGFEKPSDTIERILIDALMTKKESGTKKETVKLTKKKKAVLGSFDDGR